MKKHNLSITEHAEASLVRAMCRTQGGWAYSAHQRRTARRRLRAICRRLQSEVKTGQQVWVVASNDTLDQGATP